jgi:long-chain fatty acid transport protein
MTRTCPSPKTAASALALGLALSALPRAETSPLSVLPEGYGLEVSAHNAREKAMGEAGMASVNKQGPSIPNPSRTAWNDKTSFSATFDSDVDWLQDADHSNRTTTFLIPDIALNFQTRIPLNFGLYYRQRFQRNFTFTPLAQSDKDAAQSFGTEGGLYELSATVAYAPATWLALSVGYNFILGRERFIESAAFDRNPGNPDLFNGANLKGDTVSVRSSGAYPTMSLTLRQKSWSVGAAASLEADLDRTLTREVTAVASARKSTDTRTLPWTLQVGAAYKPAARQTLAADFAWEAWDESGNDALNPAFKAGVGYEFQGSGTTYEAYYKKMALRGGLGFERLYLDETDQYYVTMGTGLPLGRRGNMLDIALKYGHRGDLENNLWTEDFLKVSATLTGVSVWGQPIRKRR